MGVGIATLLEWKDLPEVLTILFMIIGEVFSISSMIIGYFIAGGTTANWVFLGIGVLCFAVVGFLSFRSNALKKRWINVFELRKINELLKLD